MRKMGKITSINGFKEVRTNNSSYSEPFGKISIVKTNSVSLK